MIISIASGKGGTGKTTVATNLTMVIDEELTLLDCDVEEPNVHLFLDYDVDSSKPIYAEIPDIDDALCDGCGKCSEICRFRALTLVGKKVLVFPELCHSCGGCKVVCPQNAIKEGQRELGTIEKGHIDDLSIVTGCMRIGETMAPPLIEMVRDESNNQELVIIDAPPGTSCPVISAIRGTDFVVLVTEPTPFGLNDLILAVETVKQLGMPFGIVVNRAGIGDMGVYEYAKEQNIPIIMELPFDREIAGAYSKGKMIVREFPHLRDEFTVLYQKIRTIVNGGGVQ